MKEKKKILNYIVLIFVFIAIVFRYYQSPDSGYRFIYPSWWHKQIIEDGRHFFYGSVFSIYPILDNETSADSGGFIMITSSETENKEIMVKDYIQKLKDDEWLRVKSGGMPIVPGVSQYEHIPLSQKPVPGGFEEVRSLYSMSTLNEADAHEYWKIKNNKLYIIRLRYPLDKRHTMMFDLGTKLIFWTFGSI